MRSPVASRSQIQCRGGVLLIKKNNLFQIHQIYAIEVFLRPQVKCFLFHIESRDKPESVSTWQSCRFQLFLRRTSALPQKCWPHIKKRTHRNNYSSIIYHHQVPLCYERDILRNTGLTNDFHERF